MVVSDIQNPSTAPQNWWRERELWWVLALTAVIFLPRLGSLMIRGEESRRAVIAQEMIDRGDWIVPRTQGLVRLSRPPLQNWMIAGLALVEGEMSAWSIRLPGVIATLLTVALIYWYARRRLAPTASLLAATAYLSALHVLEQGRTGETEPVFTLILAAALLLWHGYWMDGRLWTAWMLGGTLGGLAMMTKGVQAPLYWFGAVGGYLILTGQWRAIVSRGALVGSLLFFSSIGLWQALFMSEMGFEAGWRIYFWNIETRFTDQRSSAFWSHLATYPFEVWLGSLAPWGVLLLAYTRRSVREALGHRKDMAVFLALSIAICFPSVWIPPGSRPRYFMPLFPAFALLGGIVMQLWLERQSLRAGLWTFFVRANLAAMVVAAVTIPTLCGVFAASQKFASLGEGLGFAVLALCAVGFMVRCGVQLEAWRVQGVCLTLAAFLGLSYVGPILSSMIQRSGTHPQTIAALKLQLPADPPLHSFGLVHHVFLYYLQRPVILNEVPQPGEVIPADIEYFCFDSRDGSRLDLPFPWEEVAVIAVDRTRREIPRDAVVIGRRLVQREHASTLRD